MKAPPTDLQILREIYSRYYDTFTSFSKDDPSRRTKVYVPIEIGLISSQLGVDSDIVFGRLYYHLSPKFSYTQSDGTAVSFFMKQFSEEDHVIQFPLLAATLADLEDAHEKHQLATWLSIAALVVAAFSLIVSFQ